MKSLGSRIKGANTLLAPYAVPHDGGLGREHDEPADTTRFPFQRDRDRIVHSQSFRRLKHKTQVFVSGHGDHYRTRITHTLEVAQVSRGIARTLELNEDLAEAIAIAHDLGHTPFGHAGEEAIGEALQPFGKTFEHNEQSLRIVTLLEDHSRAFPGLNLRREILEGLQKHSSLQHAPTLEAQVVNIADEIAYTAHDTDDGIRAKQFTEKDIATTALGKRAIEHANIAGTELRGAIVHLLVSDLYEETDARLRRLGVRTLRDVYGCSEPLVGFSPAMQKNIDELRGFLWKKFYGSPFVLRQASRGKRIIRTLFQAYYKNPPRKVKLLQQKTGGDTALSIASVGALEEAIKDYIAGMTDPYALTAYESL